MANLLYQNIGTNYKGLLNLDATTINTPLDATLRAVTDGMGNSSVLQLSTTQVRIDSGVTNRRLTFGSNGQMSFVNDNDFIIDYSNGSVNILRLAYTGTDARFDCNGIVFLNISGTAFTGLIKIGGTTSSFPAIKRNGAAIDFRLADDSGYCAISAKGLTLYDYNGITANSGDLPIVSTSYIRVNTNQFVIGGGGYGNASAKLEVESTTQGFLMPRQTTAQINAIATPANGLQVYNTDLAQPCFYDGTGWRKVSHSAM